MNINRIKILRRLYVTSRTRFNMQRNDSIGALQRAWSYVFASYLQGDYFEFGVYQGESLVSSYLSYQYYWKWLNKGAKANHSDEIENFKKIAPSFHAFDTFEGMPKNNEGHEVHTGSFGTTLDLVKKKCLEYGLIEPQLKIYKGLFADSSFAKDPKSNNTLASIVNIDCDLYFSAKDALNIIRPCLQQGTVMMFDDFNIFAASNEKGERRAVREWLIEEQEIVLEPWFAYGPAGQAFFCHIKS